MEVEINQIAKRKELQSETKWEYQYVHKPYRWVIESSLVFGRDTYSSMYPWAPFSRAVASPSTVVDALNVTATQHCKANGIDNALMESAGDHP